MNPNKLYTESEVIAILSKYHDEFLFQHNNTVLETTSKPRWPSPRKWFNKNVNNIIKSKGYEKV